MIYVGMSYQSGQSYYFAIAAIDAKTRALAWHQQTGIPVNPSSDNRYSTLAISNGIVAVCASNLSSREWILTYDAATGALLSTLQTPPAIDGAGNSNLIAYCVPPIVFGTKVI